MVIDLDFVKDEKSVWWTAEFVATSNFNLHVETENTGALSVEQSGIENGLYAKAYTTNIQSTGSSGERVFDCDFGALVYPKYIRVKCDRNVLVGKVTLSEG